MLKRILLALLLMPSLAVAQQSTLTRSRDTQFPRLSAGSDYYREWDACAGGTSTSGSDNWLASSTGTGATNSAQVPSELNDPCAAKIDLGTVATNDSGIRTQTAAFDIGNGELCLIGWVRELVVSDASVVDYVARFGFSELDSAPTRFVGFRYNWNVNGGKWQYVSRTGSVETGSATDSGITFTASTSRWLKVCINAAGTTATYYHSTTSPYNMTVIGTQTANMPTATVGAGLVLERTVGTAASSPMSINFLAVEFKPTTPRW